jgi:hypothetical protein
MQPMKKNVLFLALFTIITLVCSGQKEANNPLQTIVKEMAGSDVYEVSCTVGFTGAISKQYQRFKQLLSLASIQQLTELALQHKAAVVRLYALQALKQKRADISHNLVKQFQNDQAVVITLNGCNANEETVSELAKQDLVFSCDVYDK